MESIPPPPWDAIEHRRIVAEAEARLFGGEPEPVSVGRFRLAERIGAGALGVVYAAEDPQLQRTVAIKRLRTVDDRARLLREARAMARLAAKWRVEKTALTVRWVAALRTPCSASFPSVAHGLGE